MSLLVLLWEHIGLHSSYYRTCKHYLFWIRWRAAHILRKVPLQDRPEVQLKCVAYDILQQRRTEWGLQRKWYGNYLAKTVSNC